MERHHDAHNANHAHDHLQTFETPVMVELAELEGEVLAELAERAAARLLDVARADGVEVRTVVDLGSGPGIGSCMLARCFPAATVLAVDGSAAMLARATARAERLGLGSRVETRLLQLPDGFEALDRADVAWASMALHHLGDEVAAMRRVRDRLRPGGLFAVVERGEPMRYLPADVDLGRPGLWQRLDAAWATWFEDMRAELPGATPSAGHAAMLRDAGLEVLVDEVITHALGPPMGDAARRLAHEHLRRTAHALAGRAHDGDLQALEPLVDEHGADSILHRPDARLLASRRLTIGRAPAAGGPLAGAVRASRRASDG